MKPVWVAALSVLLGCVQLMPVIMQVVLVAAQQPPVCPNDLARQIDLLLSRKELFRSQNGLLVEVYGLDGSDSWTTLYERDADNFKTPASNNKVVTTAPAYLQLGSTYTIKTDISASSQDTHVTELATVCITTRGDPSMTTTRVLNAISQFKTNFGSLNTVDNLVLDVNWFTPDQPFPTSWEWEDVTSSDGAQPVAAIVNENTVHVQILPTADGQPPKVQFDSEAERNCMTVTNRAVTGPSVSINTASASYELANPNLIITGAVPAGGSGVSATVALLQPVQFFLCLANYALTSNGVTVKAKNVGTCTNDLQKILTVQSDPLNVMMNHTLQESDNLYAEVFQLTQGALLSDSEAIDLAADLDQRYPGKNAGHPFVVDDVKQPGLLARLAAGAPLSTRDKGILAVRNTLLSRFPWIPADGWMQRDGSGLSPQGLLSPRGIMGILKGMRNQTEWRTFLPVAGQSGTLRTRFIGKPAQGIVQAKTGTLTGVNSLSGYLTQLHGEFPPILFSFISNASNQRSSVVRQSIDDVINLLAVLRVC